MDNREKFFELAYKVLKFLLWFWIFGSVYGVGCLIGLLLRYNFF